MSLEGSPPRGALNVINQARGRDRKTKAGARIALEEFNLRGAGPPARKLILMVVIRARGAGRGARGEGGLSTRRAFYPSPGGS